MTVSALAVDATATLEQPIDADRAGRHAARWSTETNRHGGHHYV